MLRNTCTALDLRVTNLMEAHYRAPVEVSPRRNTSDLTMNSRYMLLVVFEIDARLRVSRLASALAEATAICGASALPHVISITRRPTTPDTTWNRFD